MNVCTGNEDWHDEIVHDCIECPLCAQLMVRAELEKEVDNLKEKLDNIENEE